MAKAQPSDLRLVLAENIRARRKVLGLSQEELADRAEVHRTVIGTVERGESNVSLDNIARIGTALEVPAFELLRPS